MSETTRTALARVVLENPKGRWLPGMFVTGQVEVEVKEYPLVIPQTALQRVEDQESVFVKTKEGFEPRPVKLGPKIRAQPPCWRDSSRARFMFPRAHSTSKRICSRARLATRTIIEGSHGTNHSILSKEPAVDPDGGNAGRWGRIL